MDPFFSRFLFHRIKFSLPFSYFFQNYISIKASKHLNGSFSSQISLPPHQVLLFLPFSKLHLDQSFETFKWIFFFLDFSFAVSSSPFFPPKNFFSKLHLDQSFETFKWIFFFLDFSSSCQVLPFLPPLFSKLYLDQSFEIFKWIFFFLNFSSTASSFPSHFSFPAFFKITSQLKL